MKKIFFVALLLVSGLLSAQNYYVVSVEGEIFDGATALLPKHKLTAETRLRFPNPMAKAHVISPDKGLFILTGAQIAETGNNEFIVAVKNALIPPSQLKETATRGQSTDLAVKLEDAYDLLDFFRGDVAYPDTLFFQLSPGEFEEEGGYFELRTAGDNETTTYHYEATDNVLALYLPPGQLEKPAEAYTFGYQPLFAEEPEEFSPEPFRFKPVPVGELRAELAYLREIVPPGQSVADFLKNIAIPHVESRFGRVSSGWVLSLLPEEK